MIRKHWSALMLARRLIRRAAFPINIINELEHQRQRSLGRFSPRGNHLDNVLSNNVRQRQCVTCFTLQLRPNPSPTKALLVFAFHPNIPHFFKAAVSSQTCELCHLSAGLCSLISHNNEWHAADSHG